MYHQDDEFVSFEMWEECRNEMRNAILVSLIPTAIAAAVLLIAMSLISST